MFLFFFLKILPTGKGLVCQFPHVATGRSISSPQCPLRLHYLLARTKYKALVFG